MARLVAGFLKHFNDSKKKISMGSEKEKKLRRELFLFIR